MRGEEIKETPAISLCQKENSVTWMINWLIGVVTDVISAEWRRV